MILFQATLADLDAVRSVWHKQNADPFVAERINRNVLGTLALPDRERLWRAMFVGLITTQQRSGPGTAVDKFLNTSPFPLSYAECKKSSVPVRQLVLQRLPPKLRNIISDRAQLNFDCLEAGEWVALENWTQQLWQQRQSRPHWWHLPMERSASNYVARMLEGFGPKQSRNFWQHLGLTRFEVPLDSRLLNWIEKSLGVYVSPAALSDERFYCSLQDALVGLCRRAYLLPCLFDAAVFSLGSPKISKKKAASIVSGTSGKVKKTTGNLKMASCADKSVDPQHLHTILVNFAQHAATYDKLRAALTAGGSVTEFTLGVKNEIRYCISGTQSHRGGNFAGLHFTTPTITLALFFGGQAVHHPFTSQPSNSHSGFCRISASTSQTDWQSILDEIDRAKIRRAGHTSAS